MQPDTCNPFDNPRGYSTSFYGGRVLAHSREIDVLTRLLDEKGWHQRDLADRLLVDEKTVSRWMTGKTSHTGTFPNLPNSSDPRTDSMKTLPLLTLALLALSAGAAHAAPTMNPVDVGTKNRPLHSWTLPDGEELGPITVSRSSAVTPEGKFFDDDQVSWDLLAPTATQWQNTKRLPAGTFWWNLRWNTTDYLTTAYTAPQAFTIPAYLRTVRASIKQYEYFSDTVTVTYIANTTTAKVRCRIQYGRKVIRTAYAVEDSLTIAAKNTSRCETGKLGGKLLGKPAKLIVDVTAPGVKPVLYTRAFMIR